MATFDVLKRAAKSNRNFVITHEPTFYNHQDQTAAFEQDATYQAKQRFIRGEATSSSGGSTIMRTPFGRIRWSPVRRACSAGRLTRRQPSRASTSSRDHAAARSPRDIARRLEGRAIRVAGDPAMKVTRIALGPGYGVPALTTSFDVRSAGKRRSRAATRSTRGRHGNRSAEGPDRARAHAVRGLRHARSRRLAARVPDRRADRVGSLPASRSRSARTTAACLEATGESGGQEEVCFKILLTPDLL